MSKTINELIPTDEVVIKLGAKTQRNEQNGKDIIIDPEKILAVPYKYLEEIHKQVEEFDEETGYYRPFSRTIHLIGLPSYDQQKNSTGDSVAQLSVVPFETEADRRFAAQQAARADAILEAHKAAEKTRIEEETRAAYLEQLRAEAQQKIEEEAADREALKAQLRLEILAEQAADQQQKDAQAAADKAAADKAKADKAAADKAKADKAKADKAAADASTAS